MSDTRNTEQFIKNLDLIIPKRTDFKAFLFPEQQKEVIPSKVGVSTLSPTDHRGGAGGIASPLTEDSRTTTPVDIEDPFDPAYVITFERATSITFFDDNGLEVVEVFDPP